jgi:hypothetical protein
MINNNLQWLDNSIVIYFITYREVNGESYLIVYKIYGEVSRFWVELIQILYTLTLK